jgi:type II secretory pathway component PulF
VAANVALPLGLWMLLLLWVAFALPRFQELFDDFGVRLPGVTALVLRAAEVVREWPVATVGALAFLAAVDAWFDRLLVAAARYSWRQWLLGVRIAIPLGLILLTVWGVLPPWFQLRGVLH